MTDPNIQKEQKAKADPNKKCIRCGKPGCALSCFTPIDRRYLPTDGRLAIDEEELDGAWEAYFEFDQKGW